ncbi:hypothetical protein BO94DRAFT_538029 [Aspergillus sclerotioniger CBS 115572]|uniref:Serine-threonine protein kinase 19 n=1 Tax=Aspergillus sclerotioniger CBS 115572 TaxID=1450535 RepID=A0A317VS67_9EURO|nr:hypothetical protein BO94DRAFT_538029 [Aspergillus sclerotioniger CBS 115572]PWY77173.1 hypothetical protein BO94DRAFT_538029 [Aspergillus sclerotioniger CBS 115572]
MPLRITSSPVSGVKKNKKPASLRPRASPFASHARRKASAPSSSGASKLYGEHEYDQGSLPDFGTSRYIPETTPVNDVVQALQYIHHSMFESLPRRVGMNSARIAEVLNFRRSLPPLASVAHVHTLLDSPTEVEKEIVELVHVGRVRRLIVPERGNDAAGLGDCLVLTEEWERLVQDSSALDTPLKGKFLELLGRIGNTCAIPGTAFSLPETMALVRAGFLVSSSALAKGSSSLASLPVFPATSTIPASASARQGGTEQTADVGSSSDSQSHTATFFISLPNTGPYLRLLSASRSHLLSLLKRSSSSEVPGYLLRDRWDGAVESEKSFSAAKRARGEFAGILPGRTKRWKELYGINFRWVLEEALGAGLIEIFDTGSVGPGVRCL